MNFAVLLTCHNRKEKTKKCLENLFHQSLPNGAMMDVFVCDDGSKDGTFAMIEELFPTVNVILGSGSLYWNGGMNLVWKTALERGNFDFFIWLNDDTFLFENAIISIFEDLKKVKNTSLITAAIKRPNSEEYSYGGQNEKGNVIPNGTVQEVITINGNFVLIPSQLVEQIGVLSPDFTHYFGDNDYGLRAIYAGNKCYTSSRYLGECELNQLPFWGDARRPFKKRWELLHSVKGLSIVEYSRYLSRHHGKLAAFKNLIFSYSRVISPSFYHMIRRLISE